MTGLSNKTAKVWSLDGKLMFTFVDFYTSHYGINLCSCNKNCLE